MGTEAVRITAGTKRFGDSVVLDGIDLAIESGEFVAVLGRSGSGKSTLLRVLAGLESLSSGTVSWPAGGERPHIGVVFQDALLLPWLTVQGNVSYARRFAHRRKGFDADYAAELMRRFGVDGLADRYPDQLSGGQAQRVAILRAVATRPQLLLLDEPFSALDPATRADLQQWLTTLTTELGVTVLLVTHDVEEALTLAQRVVLLADGGRIQRQWHLEETDRSGLRDEILSHYRVSELWVA
ncbi:MULTISPECIES: ABC transporter ATP-binding protein [unclassified Mycobacterium]|uniref:ABC transporter ATP-binding protein n=1 Tax=unclassified Mycobacterium TaxID=2642494 RepID=UPI000491B6AC|nr:MULTISPECIES: ABC transporter ATP-binding protein [unclassified Mycobacterium]SEB03049.1 ABC-type nitrate/sulfonate/bicarbonate transport system, ATPase component [Mycobacterium sp. 283mftsu]